MEIKDEVFYDSLFLLFDHAFIKEQYLYFFKLKDSKTNEYVGVYRKFCNSRLLSKEKTCDISLLTPPENLRPYLQYFHD